MSTKQKLHKLVEEVLKNKFIRARAEELKLTSEELISALPILITIDEESKKGDSDFKTSFERNASGNVVATKIINTASSARGFIDNIITYKYYPVDFDFKNKLNEKLSGQKEVAIKFAPFIRSGALTNKGFYIFGASGVGKSFLLKKFVQLSAEKGHTVAYMPVHELVALLRTSNFDLKAPIIKDLKAADFLFLDDIGSETIYYWLRDEVLFPVLSYRLEKHKPTFFSSIYSYAELEKVEAKTTGEKFPDKTQASRLVTIIRNLTEPFELK